MKRIEQFIIGVILVGVLFKVQHWPMAGFLLIIGLSLLSMLYFPLGALWFGLPERRDQIVWLSVLCGFALSVQLIGILFKLQHWPLAGAYLQLGIGLCILAILLALAMQRQKPELERYFRNLIMRVGIFGVVGSVILFAFQQTPNPIDADGPNETHLPPVSIHRADWAQQISDSNAVGVFVLWEPDLQRLQASDTARALRGFLPASTFKVFNSLVALQEGAVANEHTMIPWDGVTRRSTDWNEDQDMAQAIARSTVWWYQEVARRAGVERMQHWLDTVAYGNHTMGDSIHLFWLQGALRITPMEQIHFMETLHDEQLPFDVRHQRTVKRIMPGDSTATWKLQGKSGWAIRVDDEYGWYVGWVEHAGRSAYFALNIDIKDMDDVRKRYTITRALLQREGWIDASPSS